MRQAAHARTTTVMFTDIVGSTQLIHQLGHVAAHALFALQRTRLQRVLRLTGGRELQWLGDGALVSFEGTGDAIRSAIILQKSTALATPAPVQLRIGINVGDMLYDGDGSPFGLPLVIARRLCDRATAGQILCSAAVEAMTMGRPEFRFRPVGNVKLKGIETDITVCEVAWHTRADAYEARLKPAATVHSNGTLPGYQA